MRVTWNAFQDFKHEGLVKSIGVANFLPHHFAALEGEVPVIDQIEYHIGYLQEEAFAYCKEHDILVEGWAALGRAELLQSATVQTMAATYQVNPAQLCLRFCLQQGVLPLVKSADEQRMRLNRDVFSFTITAADMEKLKSVGQVAWSGEHPDKAIPLDPAD